MSRQIIRKDNGKYCVYSTISDRIILDDADRGQVYELEKTRVMESFAAEFYRLMSKINDPLAKPYHQSTMTYEEAIEREELIHGNGDTDED